MIALNKKAIIYQCNIDTQEYVKHFNILANLNLNMCDNRQHCDTPAM